ncbi:MAG: hypothetical protein KDA89_00535 [Planctomycetaceae bacterium]|nr:hypothetical protein [Planctomycetaceae bacterium]
MISYEFGNEFTSGSTRSGKSYFEVQKTVAAADSGQTAIVQIDPHPNSLCAGSFRQLVARGHEHRILYDQLPRLDRVLGIQFLRASTAADSLTRLAEDEQYAREFADVLMRRREMKSMASSPQTEEWTIAAILFLIRQRKPHPAGDLPFAFRPNSAKFAELLCSCTDPDLREKFREVATGVVKRGYYAAAQRLIDSVCASPAFAARSGTSFDLERFLDRKGILLIEGGSHGISEDAMRTIMGAVILQVISYVRRRRSAYPRVLLQLDEATNANLIGAAGHEVRAMAECQKMGLDVHVLVQSPNFPSSFITDAVLTNCLTHTWFYAANESVARMAAADLGDPDLKNEVRSLSQGQCYIKRRHNVQRFVVPPFKDPWTFPELSARKATEAHQRILLRSEYQEPTWNPPNHSTGANATPSSAASPGHTRSASTTSVPSSPADRLRTGELQNCADANGCDTSEPSS